MAISKTKTWNSVLESVKVLVSPAIFSTWFTQTHIEDIKKEEGRTTVYVGCHSTFVKSTIEGRYFGIIQKALRKELENKCDLIFVVKTNPNKKSEPEKLTPLFNQKKESEDSLISSLAKSQIRPSYTFSNFAVSSTNQMAWAAAEAVSNTPGDAYNPLFIWGGVGVGKTHLMNAIGYSILKSDADAKIMFCTAEIFTNDIVEGIRSKRTQHFRDKYRKLAALFIDDIQFIAGKDAVQEEFFHTFNALVARGGQVVLTSDKPPQEIAKLEERLKSRFEAGLIVDVSQPDFELRCAIIQIKSKEKGLTIPMDLVQLIAGNIVSPRQIEGFIIRLMSESKLNKIEISKDLIQKILGKGIENNTQQIKATPVEVISAVSSYFSINKRDLLGKSRARVVAHPRQMLMYILRTELNIPLQEIGKVIGRDHTTVMHAVQKITQLTSSDVDIRQDILGIKNKL